MTAPSVSLTAACDASNAVVLIIDLQGKVLDQTFNSDQVTRVVDQLLRTADLFEVPVVVTEQYPRGLGATVPAIQDRLATLAAPPHRFDKTAFGCGAEPGFTEQLADLARARRRPDTGAPPRAVDVVVAGIETHVCVQQTVLDLLQRGYRVVVLADGTGSRSKANHTVALERFRQAGAIVSCFESVAFEWARTKDHPCFKAMSAIVKEGGPGG